MNPLPPVVMHLLRPLGRGTPLHTGPDPRPAWRLLRRSRPEVFPPLCDPYVRQPARCSAAPAAWPVNAPPPHP